MSDVRVIGDAAIEVSTRAGLIKRFGRAGDSYRLATVEDPYGNRLDLGYSPHGGLQRIDSSSGAWVVVTRDGEERVKSILDSHGRSVRYEYDSNGRLATVTDPGEHDWHYGYDAANRLVSTTTPNDFNDVEFRYGAAGRVVMSRAHGVRSAFEYRDTKTIVTDSKELATTYSAGASGLTTEVINPLGTTTVIRLARSGLPIALVRNAMRIAEFSVEQSAKRAESHARFVSPASAESYRLRYDSLGRLTRLSSQTRGRLYEVERYGPGLIPEKVVHADDRREEAQFDERGELTRLIKRDGSELVLVRDGEHWQIGDASGRQVDLRFDPTGRLISAATPEGHTLHFGYNDIGLRESTETSYGALVRYQYDASGSLFHSQSGYAKSDQIPAHTYVFGVDHRLDEVRGSGGDRHEYTYGPSGLLLALRSSVLTRDVIFEYDELARLRRVQYEGKAAEHNYAPGEPDLAARAAVRSLPVFNQQREITDFPSRFDAGLTRTRASSLGLMTYDEVRHELTLAADPTRWDPMSPLTRSIAASRIEGLLRDGVPGLQAFTIPSNRLFVPREYESVNCCICLCDPGVSCDPL